MVVSLAVLIDGIAATAAAAAANFTSNLRWGTDLRTVIRGERPLSARVGIDQRWKKSLGGMREAEGEVLYVMTYPLKSCNSGRSGQAGRAESERCRGEEQGSCAVGKITTGKPNGGKSWRGDEGKCFFAAGVVEPEAQEGG